MPPGACNIFFSKPNTLKSAVNWVISWVFARLLTYRVNCLWHDAAESFFPAAAAAISKFITFCDDIFAWVFFFLCHCIYWHFSAAQYLIRLIHCPLCFETAPGQALVFEYLFANTNLFDKKACRYRILKWKHYARICVWYISRLRNKISSPTQRIFGWAELFAQRHREPRSAEVFAPVLREPPDPISARGSID